MTIEVRPVRPNEHEEAGRVTAEAYREFADGGDGWSEYLERIADVADRAERTMVLVATEDGRVLGTLTLELDRRVEEDEDHREGERLPPHQAHVRMLGVDPSARGRGVGGALMEESIRVAKHHGKTLMTLNTTSRMQTAQRMYEGMGFVRQPDWQVSEDFSLLAYELKLG
jgi:GNAT superfamily N-acetyltransferase